MLALIGRVVAGQVTTADPWPSTYAWARSVLAVTTALTLVANPTRLLFVPRVIEGAPEGIQCNVAAARIGLFCLTGAERLEAARWLAVVILAVVATGWRPRWMGVLHWWVTFSVQVNATIIDGGDQLAAILTLLLIPLTIGDGRRWHWQARDGRAGVARSFVARWFFGLIRLQVAIVYAHAAIAKCAVAEWQDGTALYYWLTHPLFGAPAWAQPMLRPLLLNATIVTIATLFVIVLELTLAAGLLADRRYYSALFVSGVLLHAAIAVAHGLVSFSLTMVGALLLYVGPTAAAARASSLLRRFVATAWPQRERFAHVAVRAEFPTAD